jgi:prepilin-type N-terminal cleavage/methylation domain-containing protein
VIFAVPRRSRAGVTLIEMLIVVALISLFAGLMFPSVASGLETLRLQQASDGISGFLNIGLNRAERNRVVVEITIDKAQNALTMCSTEPGFSKRLEMPDGVRIVDVLPPAPEDIIAPRRFLLYPGGSPPRFGVEIENRKNVRRIVRMDPVTGVPQVERVGPQ